MDTQKIKQLLTLIANKSKSQTDYGNTKKYIMEIIDYPIGYNRTQVCCGKSEVLWQSCASL